MEGILTEGTDQGQGKEKNEYRLTLSMASYLRPKRTIRAIEGIVAQNVNDWEALIVGDGCPVMQDFIDSNYFGDMVAEASRKGNSLNISNLSENKGGWGYYIHNTNIQRAKGKYFMFMCNDDVIHENHFNNYLTGIEGTDLDFAYYNSFMESLNCIRITQLYYGAVGHSELIIKTDFLKRMPPHGPEFGHDWHLIQDMMNATDRFEKVDRDFITYVVKGVLELRDDEID